VNKTVAEQAKEVRILAELSVFVALAAVLHFLSREFLPWFRLPQGGSITIGSMVPLLWFAMRRGVRWGVEAGIVFGLVDLALPGSYFISNPFEILLDYPMAFGALGLAGAFKKQPILAVSVGFAGRFVFHFISGAVFFYMYAWPGWNPVLYSLAYNATYLVPELVISVIIIYLIALKRLLDLYL